MSEFKGTKGPWDFKDVGICRQDRAGLQLGFVMTADESRVNECAANAHLIVSAPDLLEALQNMVTAYEYEASIDNPALLAARAAITKALGETK